MGQDCPAEYLRAAFYDLWVQRVADLQICRVVFGSMKKTILIISSSAVLILILVSQLWFGRFNQEWLKAKTGDVTESVYGLGTVLSGQTYQVKSAVNLAVLQVLVQEGQQVEKGARLIEFDDKFSPKAPFAGTITDVRVRSGEIIAPQVPIITVTDLKTRHIEVSLEQQWILRIKKSMLVTITFESQREQTYTGHVTAVYPKDQQFIVRIDLEKFPDGVLPGMTADVAIEVGKKQDVVLIPLKALSAGTVTRKRDGRKEKIKVELGIVDGEWGELTGGDLKVADELLSRR